MKCMDYLKCLECGNTKSFSVGAVEYHRYEVDAMGNYVADIDCGDIKRSDDYQCMECDSFNVKWVELDLKSEVPTTS